ncbi:hypothetical protein [Tissierella sp.]|uniref:hypothetical protein n=1 Tax=Tissierella sp. TaxID=41274 RepID=UPI003072D60D
MNYKIVYGIGILIILLFIVESFIDGNVKINGKKVKVYNTEDMLYLIVLLFSLFLFLDLMF